MLAVSTPGVAVASTLHDPRDELHRTLGPCLALLTSIFPELAVQVSAETSGTTLALLQSRGARVAQETGPVGPLALGRARRAAVADALTTGARFVLVCDLDRFVHWASRLPSELASVPQAIAASDFTVIGRTRRAFATHPACQRQTEAIVNGVFALVSGCAWDVTAGARGLSARAAKAIIDGCPDDGITVDVSWPLFALHDHDLCVEYFEADGLEFEIATKQPKELEAAGGVHAWMAAVDADPKRWAFRLDLARRHVEAMAPWGKPPTDVG